MNTKIGPILRKKRQEIAISLAKEGFSILSIGKILGVSGGRAGEILGRACRETADLEIRKRYSDSIYRPSKVFKKGE